MQLGTEIGKMTRELFIGSAKCPDFANVPKNARGYVPPEAIRQTRNRPVSGRPMGHSEKTRLAVTALGER